MTTELDFDAAYKVDGMPGVAWHILKYNSWREPIDEFDSEEIEDRSQVVAVMVGDDRKHIIDVDDLIVIDDDEYCGSCGQIGCGWH